MSKNILVTGSAGFLGSHFIDEVLKHTDWTVTAMCRLKYIGDIRRILNSPTCVEHQDRIKIVYHDLKFELPPHTIEELGRPDYIAHIAANSHVDRSITHPRQFFEDNALGTLNLLEWYRVYCPEALFINYLTDEVFGPAPMDYDFKEDDRWRPSNPYSASKAAQGAFGIAYGNTYNLPIIHTYTMNLFGERQNKEKFVASTISKLYKGQTIDVHAQLDKNGKVEYVGQRHWLYVGNAASATLFTILNGKAGEHYNVVGELEMNNDDLAKQIAKQMGVEIDLSYTDFSVARPGHDRRYSLDGTKLHDMGWRPPIDFDTALQRTIDWMEGEIK